MTLKNFILLAIISLSIKANAQWTLCNKPSGALPFSLAIHNDTIFMGTVSSGIYRSTDGGSNWTQINNGITSMQIWTINKVGGAFFASSTGGNVFKSTNGGNSWVLSNSGITSTAIVRKFVLFNGKIFATTTNLGVIVSNDNGSTWVQHNTGIVGLVSETLMVVENDLYVGVNQKVYKYDIANQNWVSKSSGVPNNTVGSLTYIKDNMQNITLFVGNANSNDVAKSTNGGDNWSIADNGLPNIGVFSLLGIGTAVFAGNEWGVYQTNDQGANWIDISGFTNTSHAKFLSRSSTDLYVLQGAELWKKSLTSLGITGIDEVELSREISIFPNPADNFISIKSKSRFINYDIINMVGQKIMSGKLNSETIEVGDLEKGFYILNLNTTDNKKATSMFLIN